MADLTVKGLEAIKPGEWLAESVGHGAGSLVAYGAKVGGAAFYFRYIGVGGKRDTLPIGRYDRSGNGGLTLADARLRARELSRRYQTGDRDLRAALEAEAREAERLLREAEREKETEQARQSASLGALLDAYVANLKRQGKVSWREVESAVRLHIEKPWPTLWATPAERISTDDLLCIVTRLSDAGKLREAGKMRSYLRAAYSSAIKARRLASALPALRDLGLSTNPARDLEPIDGGAGGSRERALSIAELRAYWRRISKMPGNDGALLRFHLLSGGQRVRQLARLVSSDFDTDLNAVQLRDIKGRRKEPRMHVVPLVPAAVDALQEMTAPALGPYLFSIDGGQSGASYFLIQTRIRGIVDAMAEAGELENGPFTAGDLRRTVESRLAGARVSKDDRAQLQSHGLSGVQSRHYDKHDYFREKEEALKALYRLVTGEAAKVSPIRRATNK